MIVEVDATNSKKEVKEQQVNHQMVERVPSNASSVRTVHNQSRPQTASRIYLGDSPPVDVDRCRTQLKADNVILPEKIDPEMIGKPDEYFDGRNEECFVLDSFNALIQSSRQAKKEFLLARVMTVDPQDPTRTYWSYYAAHQINKVLFRTQPDQMLLHRMRCRNPLNNMLIVGNVHYFTISPDEVDRAHREYEEATGEKVKSLVGVGKRNNSTASLFDIDRITYALPALTKSMSMTDVATPGQIEEGIGPGIPAPALEGNTPGTAGQPKPEDKPSAKTYVRYRAKYIGSDEDFLQRQNFRAIFEQQAISPDDAELFPLQPTHGRQPVRIVTNPQGAVQVRREPLPTPTWSNLGGSIYWPPKDSMFIRGTGILTEVSFGMTVLITLGVTLALGLFVFPIWALIVGGPVTVVVLAILAFTIVHFRD